MAWALWLAAALVLSIIEVLSVDLFFLMLALAAAGAGAGAALGLGFEWQIAIFALLAIVLLFLLRPWAKRVLVKSTPNLAMNVHALVGRDALVTEEVNIHDGRVRLDGEIWSARAEEETIFSVGEKVIVKSIEGATAIVAAATPKKESE